MRLYRSPPDREPEQTIEALEPLMVQRFFLPHLVGIGLITSLPWLTGLLLRLWNWIITADEPLI